MEAKYISSNECLLGSFSWKWNQLIYESRNKDHVRVLQYIIEYKKYKK